MVGAILAVVLAVAAVAQNLYPSGWKPIAVDTWKGVNYLQDSTMIDGEAQAAQNVLTDSGFLEKRPGNVRLGTILAGYPVQYVNNWTSASGNLYLIAQASQTVYQTNFSASPVALSTVAAGFNITTTAAFSRLEVADGNRALWYWTGSSSGTVTDATSGAVAPICTYVAFKDNALWCANLPNGFSIANNTQNGGGSSTVLISSKGGDGYWAVPSNVAQVDNAPNRFDFTPNDGDQITCLATTPWGMFVGKRYSSYIVKGNGNLSYDPRVLDPKIGCVDNRSVQMVYGVLKWLAVDGIYAYNGGGSPQLLSRKLDPLIANARESTYSQGQWATQLQSDWQSGTESTGTNNLPAASWDTVSIPGEVFPSSFTLYDDNTNPGLQKSGKLGFSSDTMVNIDTTSFPLSVGWAQLRPSSSALSVWLSTFPTASPFTYNAISTWTVNDGDTSWTGASPGASCLSGASPSALTCFMYTLAPTNVVATDQRLYGHWKINMTFVGTGSPCAQFGQTCLDFRFIDDSNDKNTSWTGYGLSMIYKSGSGGATIDTLTLYKSISGVQTTLASTDYTFTSLNGSFGITRTPGGLMEVTCDDISNGCVTSGILMSASDTDTHITKAYATVVKSLTVLDSGVAIGVKVTTVTLYGYGSGTITSRIYNTKMGAPLPGVINSTSTLAADGSTSVTLQVRSSTSPNNDLWSSYTTPGTGVPTNMGGEYWQYKASLATTISTETPQFQTFSLNAITTGYYYSQVDFVGKLITSWLQFGITENNPGTYNYWVREATYSFSPSATSPSWTAQTANQNVNLAVSTPTYAQFRLDSTALTNSNTAEPVSAVFLHWNQGANIPVASATLNRRYHLCVTISTAATAPDTCLVQQKTGDWVPWIGPSVGAMGYYNNQMVAADGGTSSNVWLIMQPNVYSDDGTPINAQWVSSDFTGGLIFNKKAYYGAMIDALPVLASSVTYGYQMDKANNFTTTQVSTDDGQSLDPTKPVIGAQYGDINQWVPSPNGSDVGKYIRVQFSDNQANNYFRINSYLIFIEPQPWQEP